MKLWLMQLGSWIVDLLTQPVVLLSVGGAIGTCLRYYLGKWVAEQLWGGPRPFPYGTLLINVSGSFILGAAATVIRGRLSPAYDDWYLLLCIGFCGGYTTFSTFEWETYKLIQVGAWWLALANVLVSVVAGFAAVVLGVALVNGLFSQR